MVFIEERLFEVRRCQILILVCEGKIDLRRVEHCPVTVNLPAPVSARIEDLVLALLVDEDFLVCLKVQDLVDEVDLSHGVEEVVQV